MTWVNCKNETEKLAAIKQYCNAQIKENNHSIEAYKADRVSRFDYADEIHELEIANNRFSKILEIIDADEYTHIPL